MAVIPIYARDGSVKAQVLVDDSDHAELAGKRWKLSTSGYAVRNYWVNRVCHHESMARTILGVDDPRVHVDHINGNRLDNRRRNLRAVTPAQNMRNKSVYRNNRTGFKGVEFRPDCGGRYRAVIKIDRRNHYLGWFATAEEAARAYNDAARDLHGEFARLNEVAA